MRQKSANIIHLAYGEAASSAYISLREYFNIKAVVTPPGDYPLLPVEIMASKDGVGIKRLGKIREISEYLAEEGPDLVVVCSYDKILPEELLGKIPFFNVHYAPLPRYRGRATVNWAIINGERTFAACIHKIVPELDAGDVYLKGEIRIDDRDTIEEVYGKLNEVIKETLGRTVLGAFKGEITPVKADKDIAPSYCCTRLPEDGFIDWSRPTIEIDRLIRAVGHPFPGAFTYLNGEKIYIWKAQPVINAPSYEGRVPGRIVNILKGKGVEVLTGDGIMLIDDVQFEGREPCNATEVIKSVKVTLGVSPVGIYTLLRELKKRTL